MSPLKFEDLPNEILLDLFEKYIPGIDLLTSFYLQQNARINNLIRQCRPLHLNFVDCRLEEFDYCLHRLKTIQNRIGSLTFTQERIPEQLHRFLATCTLSAGFQQLRHLSLSIDLLTNHWSHIRYELSSSTTIKLETLNLRFVNARNQHFSFSSLTQLFKMPTLKRLKLDIDTAVEITSDIRSVRSGIDYLTLAGFFIIQANFIPLLMSFPRLKYLDIETMDSPAADGWPVSDDGTDIASCLHTMKIFICGNFSDFNTFFPDLSQLKSLRNLIIYGFENILWRFEWQNLLETFLPNLIQFHLRTMVRRSINYISCVRKLRIFNTQFWREKSKFAILVGDYQSNDLNRPYRSDRRVLLRSSFEQPLIRQWIFPRRPLYILSSMVEHVRTLDLCFDQDRSLLKFYFKNVTDLVFNEFNTNVLESLERFLNLLKIKHVDLIHLEDPQLLINSFLQRLNNLRSIRMSYALFLLHRICSSVPLANITHLDIVTRDNAPLSEANILELMDLFPCVEHLTVNLTTSINVARLSYHWPSLNTFTHRISSNKFQKHQCQRHPSRPNDQSVARLYRCDNVDVQPTTHWIDRRAFLLDSTATELPSCFFL